MDEEDEHWRTKVQQADGISASTAKGTPNSQLFARADVGN